MSNRKKISTADFVINKIQSNNNTKEMTKPPPKAKTFTHIQDVAPDVEDINIMADTLHLPNDNGYKYLLVVVDVATHEIDFEPTKDKKSSTMLKAIQKIFTRKYIKLPYATIQTDNGSEFKKEFHEFFYDNNIIHKTASPYRHSQMSMVESANKVLGNVLNSFMNAEELKTGKTSRVWVKYLPEIREHMNEHRYREPKYTKETFYQYTPDINDALQSKYNVGDSVYYALDYPQTALGKKQPTANFRTGDRRWSVNPVKISQVLQYPGKIPFRYVLDGIKYTSYTDKQLKKEK
jgi:hypothetical protein